MSNLALLCTHAVLVLATTTLAQTTEQEALVEIVADGGQEHVVFSLEGGVSLESFLAASQALLDRPIAYDASEVTGVQITVVGGLSCPRGEARRLVDRVLRRNGFVSWDDPSGDSPLITVSPIASNQGGRASLAGRGSNQLVAADDLEATPARISALYTTSFQLTNVEARALMSALSPLIDARSEGLRTVEGSNALIVTALSMDKLREIRDLVLQVDIPGPEVARVGELTDRLNELEMRVTHLHAAKDAEGDR